MAEGSALPLRGFHGSMRSVVPTHRLLPMLGFAALYLSVLIYVVGERPAHAVHSVVGGMIVAAGVSIEASARAGIERGLPPLDRAEHIRSLALVALGMLGMVA